VSGNLLGRYELLNLIGKGAMGAVYRARDTKLQRIVALKVMNAALGETAEGVARFEREAQSLALLQHPNIVTIFDYLEVSGNLCLVMELIVGEPLDRVISLALAMTVEQKLRFMASVCRALEYAHGKGLVHRDLKPSNILLAPDYSPKIVDFGVVKMMGEKLTRTNTRIGTIAYMSPEQINGKPLDHRTDIFSAGIVLYELLAGVSPFDADDTTSTMRKILLDPTPVLPEDIPGVSQRLHGVLDRALAKEAEGRYATAADFADALEQCLSAGGTQVEQPIGERRRLPDREPAASATAGAPHRPPTYPPFVAPAAEAKKRKGMGTFAWIFVGTVSVLTLCIVVAMILAAIAGPSTPRNASGGGQTTQSATSQNITPPPQPAPQETPAPVPQTQARPEQLPPPAPTEIADALAAWKQAMLQNDANRLAACYANHVERYFLQNNVTSDFIQNYLQGAYAGGYSLQSLDMQGVQQTPNDDGSVQVDFQESSSAIVKGALKQYSVHTILRFIKEDGSWKINYERQLLNKD
jgi:eukaryotic-like serine/threonine-protein kinase